VETRRELARQQEAAAAAQAQIAAAAALLPDGSVRLVKKSFAALEPVSADLMQYFYGWLFVQRPELRAMFPLAMTTHRQRVFDALARVVWSTGSPAEFADQISHLARDHRKFGVRASHFTPFFAALLAAIREFSADTWSSATQQAWEEALDCISAGLQKAAAAAAASAPPWWLGEIVRHDRRGPDLAVVTIRPGQPLPYLPGQYLSVQVARWPRIWRSYSIANAPRASGLLDLHVRAVPGGMVSNALVQHSQAGDSLLLGPAEGTLTLPENGPRRDLLCVAGGTGLAPVKALIEGVIAAAGPDPDPDRKVTLFAGARQAGALYDTADLSRLTDSYPLLTVIPVVSEDPDWTGMAGPLPDVIRQHADLENREVFVSGPGPMVAAVLRILAPRVPAERIHYDPVITTR
jgi:NAD(P)H-flavin reductase/hemoglobin-like flavoprotein